MIEPVNTLLRLFSAHYSQRAFSLSVSLSIIFLLLISLHCRSAFGIFVQLCDATVRIQFGDGFTCAVRLIHKYFVQMGIGKFFEHVLFIQKERMKNENIMGSFCTTYGSRCVHRIKVEREVRFAEAKVCILNAMRINR